MESFDIVSEVNMHEVTNAVDQAKREVSTRFRFNALPNGCYLAGAFAELFNLAIRERF